MQPLAAASATHVAVLDSRSRPLLRTGYETTVPVRYQWGADGERVAKIVGGRKTWFHYETADDAATPGLRLSAEAADDGAIVTHYLYIDGRMVARVDTPEALDGLAGAWAGVKRVVLGWFGAHAAASQHAYAVHVDQRGAVVALSDGAAGLAWRARYDAYGEAAIAVAKITMNVRLAGQYFDLETRTNDNLQREYQPSTGRYLAADPISTNPWLDLDQTSRLAGVNAFAYASNDPLGHTDSQGLYESDVHYYMTYFLAIVAGMSPDDARMMALATQFVDDDATTAPVPPGAGTLDTILSIFHNTDQLKKYHFALSDPVTGRTLKAFADNTLDINIDDSPQLSALHSYAVPLFMGGCTLPNNQSLQFMGEFLHTYEDTFAHRDTDNIPYNAAINVLGVWQLGTGHGTGGKNPDYTYNHTDALGRVWNNEPRTAVMESAVYSSIEDYMSTMNYAYNPSHLGTQKIDFNNDILQKALKDFNATAVSEDSGDMGAKVAILNDALKKLGYTNVKEIWSIEKNGEPEDGGYNVKTARSNRIANYAGLDPAEYPNAILKTAPAPGP